MIHQIYSSLPSFKTLNFHSGLNVLMVEKSSNAGEKQTRNRAGKSSLIEIIHFLTGGNADKKSLFKAEELQDVSFGMEMDLDNEKVSIERQNKTRGKFLLNGASCTAVKWKEKLGESMFSLAAIDKIDKEKERIPTFRSMFPYFARRVADNAFSKPEKHHLAGGPGDPQIALTYLIGLDWRIARDWQVVRDREKTLTELKKAVEGGDLGEIIGASAYLRTELTVAQDKLKRLNQEITRFQVHPKYAELEKEADQLTRKLSERSNENTLDHAMVRDLDKALNAENPPPLTDLDAVYQEAGISLPGLVKRRYEDVQAFHESVVRNRRLYLKDELQSAQARIEGRAREIQKIDNRRAEIMAILKNHGALEAFTKLQEEAGRLKSEVEAIRQRFQSAEILESTKSNLEIDRNHLLQRLRRDFSEQDDLLSAAILAYEHISQKLYEDAGSMTVEPTANGPEFNFKIQGSRSKGVKNMQIFCFDMMLMRLCSQRGIGPGFLVHDSHLFDGVDGRQVLSGLKAGAEAAEELGFQYIVTLNEDDAFKERVAGFDLNRYILTPRLTDATQDGGLFGIRFD